MIYDIYFENRFEIKKYANEITANQYISQYFYQKKIKVAECTPLHFNAI